MPSNPYNLPDPAPNSEHFDRKEAAQLVRQAENQAEGSLIWLLVSVNGVWKWAQGHPYFTPLLCHKVWQNAYADHANDNQAPYVHPDDVERAVRQLLEQQHDGFESIWTNLPLTERLVMAAIAESDAPLISFDQLVDALQRSGVRLMLDELQFSPQRLVESNFLQPLGNGYCFRVPLWHEWVRSNRPQQPVKEEVARLDALPNELYQRGQHFYRFKQLDLAENHLRQALKFDPTHLNAHLLLAKILCERGIPNSGNVAEAIEVLEEAYHHHAQVVHPTLVQTLLLQAEGQNQEAQLVTYERILDLEPDHPLATTQQQAISEIQAQRHLATQHENEEQWHAAIAIYNALIAKYPEQQEWPTRLQQVQIRANLTERYKSAIDNLKTGRSTSAQRLLANVIAEQPTYKEAARHLLRATTGIDVVELQQENQQLQASLNNLQAKVQELEQQTVISLSGTVPPSSEPSELSEPSEPSESSEPGERREHLSTRYPLNHLRLLWWLFISPQQMNAYQSEHGKEALHPLGNWLASSLTWLPLLLPTLAIGLGKSPSISDPFLLTTYRWLTVGIVLAWALTGWFGTRKQNDSMNIAEGITLIIALLAAGGIASHVGLVMGLIIALISALIVVYLINGSLALIMANTIALMAALIVAILVTAGVASKVGVVIGFVLTLLWALIVAPRMQKGITLGKASWRARVTFVALLVAYGLIVWYGFLGGAG